MDPSSPTPSPEALREEWLTRLETWEEKSPNVRTYLTLREEVEENGITQVCFCALGVAGQILAERGLATWEDGEELSFKDEQRSSYLPNKAWDALGLSGVVFQSDISQMNDFRTDMNYDYSWAEIAQAVRRQIKETA